MAENNKKRKSIYEDNGPDDLVYRGEQAQIGDGVQYGDLADQYLRMYRDGQYDYNMYEDPIYQQAREAYIRQGQLAAKNVQAQAAALTGGYGNSYGAMAAQQQYNAALQNLNDIVPELEANAYGRYQAEQAKNLDLAQLYLDREQQAYNRQFNEAQLAAQYGDYSGLNNMGIDTEKYESLEDADRAWVELERAHTQGEWEEQQKEWERSELTFAQQVKQWEQADQDRLWSIALQAAEFGDYSYLKKLDVDVSTAEQKELLNMALQMAELGDYSLLKELDIDTTYLEKEQAYKLAQIDAGMEALQTGGGYSNSGYSNSGYSNSGYYPAQQTQTPQNPTPGADNPGLKNAYVYYGTGGAGKQSAIEHASSTGGTITSATMPDPKNSDRALYGIIDGNGMFYWYGVKKDSDPDSDTAKENKYTKKDKYAK